MAKRNRIFRNGDEGLRARPCRIVSISEDGDSLEEDGDPDLYDVLEEVEALFKRVDVRPDSNENFFEACLGPDGRVLGASVVGIYSSEPDDGDPLRRPRYSFSVAVDEPHRRKGIARALIESVLATFPKEDVLLEGKVVNPNIVALLKELGFVYAYEDRDEFSDFDRRVGRRMYRPNRPNPANTRRVDITGDPEGARHSLIRLADKKLMAHRLAGRTPLATAEDAAQAAMVAELEARRGGRQKRSFAPERHRAMDEEIVRSASVAETPTWILKESLAAVSAAIDDEDYRDRLQRTRGERALTAFRRVEVPEAPETEPTAPEPDATDILLTALVLRVLKTLSYREREIIKLRYGFGDGYTYSYEEIGRIFRLTRERVREIEIRAHQKLQHPARMRMLEDAYRALRGS